MNQITLIGRLTKDPDVRTAQSGMQIATFTLAVDRNSKDGGADFPRVKCFGKTAEIVEKYAGKGKQIAVQGRIATDSYEDKDGKKVFVTDVIADRVELLGGKTEEKQADPSDIPF